MFLNVPFDHSYERFFIGLIASVVAVGRTPRCVLELTEYGSGRLTRLIHHIGSCSLSIHDRSRVGTPARFNMPFELGLAIGICLRAMKERGGRCLLAVPRAGAEQAERPRTPGYGGD